MTKSFELIQLYHDGVAQEAWMIRNVFNKQPLQTVFTFKQHAIDTLNRLNKPKPIIEWRVVDSSN